MKYKRFGIVFSLAIGVFLLHNPAPVAAGVVKNYCSFSHGEYCSLEKPYSPNISIGKPAQTTLKIASRSVEKAEPSSSVSPTSTPTITKTITPSPNPLPSPSQQPTTPPETPTPSPEIPVESPAGSLNADSIFDMINQHRTGKGLAAYQKDDRLCSIAQSRIPQLQNEMYGSGFVHQGFNSMDLDFWVTENMVGMPTEQAALNWWLNSGLHRRAIESTEHTHSCGACSGIVCIQLFSSFIPK